jgi:hypothetical protein
MRQNRRWWPSQKKTFSMHLKNGRSTGNGEYARKGTTSRVMVASRPKVSSDQMAAPVLEVMDWNSRAIQLSPKKMTLNYLFLFLIINYLHTKLAKLTLSVCCLVTRNWTSATKSLGTPSTNSWWDTRKYTMLRAKVTSKFASHSLRKIVDVNISTT